MPTDIYNTDTEPGSLAKSKPYILPSDARVSDSGRFTPPQLTHQISTESRTTSMHTTVPRYQTPTKQSTLASAGSSVISSAKHAPSKPLGEHSEDRISSSFSHPFRGSVRSTEAYSGGGDVDDSDTAGLSSPGVYSSALSLLHSTYPSTASSTPTSLPPSLSTPSSSHPHTPHTSCVSRAAPLAFPKSSAFAPKVHTLLGDKRIYNHSVINHINTLTAVPTTQVHYGATVEPHASTLGPEMYGNSREDYSHNTSMDSIPAVSGIPAPHPAAATAATHTTAHAGTASAATSPHSRAHTLCSTSTSASFVSAPATTSASAPYNSTIFTHDRVSVAAPTTLGLLSATFLQHNTTQARIEAHTHTDTNAHTRADTHAQSDMGGGNGNRGVGIGDGNVRATYPIRSNSNSTQTPENLTKLSPTKSLSEIRGLSADPRTMYSGSLPSLTPTRTDNHDFSPSPKPAVTATGARGTPTDNSNPSSSQRSRTHTSNGNRGTGMGMDVSASKMSSYSSGNGNGSSHVADYNNNNTHIHTNTTPGKPTNPNIPNSLNFLHTPSSSPPPKPQNTIIAHKLWLAQSKKKQDTVQTLTSNSAASIRETPLSLLPPPPDASFVVQIFRLLHKLGELIADPTIEHFLKKIDFSLLQWTNLYSSYRMGEDEIAQAITMMREQVGGTGSSGWVRTPPRYAQASGMSYHTLTHNSTPSPDQQQQQHVHAPATDTHAQLDTSTSTDYAGVSAGMGADVEMYAVGCSSDSDWSAEEYTDTDTDTDVDVDMDVAGGNGEIDSTALTNDSGIRVGEDGKRLGTRRNRTPSSGSSCVPARVSHVQHSRMERAYRRSLISQRHMAQIERQKAWNARNHGRDMGAGVGSGMLKEARNLHSGKETNRSRRNSQAIFPDGSGIDLSGKINRIGSANIPGTPKSRVSSARSRHGSIVSISGTGTSMSRRSSVTDSGVSHHMYADCNTGMDMGTSIGASADAGMNAGMGVSVSRHRVDPVTETMSLLNELVKRCLLHYNGQKLEKIWQSAQLTEELTFAARALDKIVMAGRDLVRVTHAHVKLLSGIMKNRETRENASVFPCIDGKSGNSVITRQNNGSINNNDILGTNAEMATGTGKGNRRNTGTGIDMGMGRNSQNTIILAPIPTPAPTPAPTPTASNNNTTSTAKSSSPSTLSPTSIGSTSSSPPVPSSTTTTTSAANTTANIDAAVDSVPGADVGVTTGTGAGTPHNITGIYKWRVPSLPPLALKDIYKLCIADIHAFDLDCSLYHNNARNALITQYKLGNISFRAGIPKSQNSGKTEEIRSRHASRLDSVGTPNGKRKQEDALTSSMLSRVGAGTTRSGSGSGARPTTLLGLQLYARNVDTLTSLGDVNSFYNEDDDNFYKGNEGGTIPVLDTNSSRRRYSRVETGKASLGKSQITENRKNSQASLKIMISEDTASSPPSPSPNGKTTGFPINPIQKQDTNAHLSAKSVAASPPSTSPFLPVSSISPTPSTSAPVPTSPSPPPDLAHAHRLHVDTSTDGGNADNLSGDRNDNNTDNTPIKKGAFPSPRNGNKSNTATTTTTSSTFRSPRNRNDVGFGSRSPRNSNVNGSVFGSRSPRNGVASNETGSGDGRSPRGNGAGSAPSSPRGGTDRSRCRSPRNGGAVGVGVGGGDRHEEDIHINIIGHTSSSPSPSNATPAPPADPLPRSHLPVLSAPSPVLLVLRALALPYTSLAPSTEFYFSTMASISPLLLDKYKRYQRSIHQRSQVAAYVAYVCDPVSFMRQTHGITQASSSKHDIDTTKWNAGYGSRTQINPESGKKTISLVRADGSVESEAESEDEGGVWTGGRVGTSEGVKHYVKAMLLRHGPAVGGGVSGAAGTGYDVAGDAGDASGASGGGVGMDRWDADALVENSYNYHRTNETNYEMSTNILVSPLENKNRGVFSGINTSPETMLDARYLWRDTSLIGHPRMYCSFFDTLNNANPASALHTLASIPSRSSQQHQQQLQQQGRKQPLYNAINAINANSTHTHTHAYQTSSAHTNTGKGSGTGMGVEVGAGVEWSDIASAWQECELWLSSHAIEHNDNTITPYLWRMGATDWSHNDIDVSMRVMNGLAAVVCARGRYLSRKRRASVRTEGEEDAQEEEAAVRNGHGNGSGEVKAENNNLLTLSSQASKLSSQPSKVSTDLSNSLILPHTAYKCAYRTLSPQQSRSPWPPSASLLSSNITSPYALPMPPASPSVPFTPFSPTLLSPIFTPKRFQFRLLSWIRPSPPQLYVLHCYLRVLNERVFAARTVTSQYLAAALTLVSALSIAALLAPPRGSHGSAQASASNGNGNGSGGGNGTDTKKTKDSHASSSSSSSSTSTASTTPQAQYKAIQQQLTQLAGHYCGPGLSLISELLSLEPTLFLQNIRARSMYGVEKGVHWSQMRLLVRETDALCKIFQTVDVFVLPTSMQTHSAACRSIAFSSVDPSFLITAGADGAARIWHRPSRACLAQYYASEDAHGSASGSGGGGGSGIGGGGSVYGFGYGYGGGGGRKSIQQTTYMSTQGVSIRATTVLTNKSPLSEAAQDSVLSSAASLPSVLNPANSLCNITNSVVVWARLIALDSRLITADMAGVIRIWDTKTSTVISTLTGHQDSITSCDMSSNARFLVSASIDGTARIWCLQTQTCLAALGPHNGMCSRVCFALDMSCVITCSTTGELLLWRLRSSSTGVALSGPPEHLSVHREHIHCIAAASQGRFVTVAKDGTARLWSTITHTVLATYALPSPIVVTIAILASSDLLAIACLDRTISIFHIGSGALLRCLRVNIAVPTALVWADETMLLVGTEQGQVVEVPL